MAVSFSEVLKQLEQSRQELAVWNVLTDYLTSFVDTDTSEAKNQITAEGCISKLVSQETIAAVIEAIELEKAGPLNEHINELENLQIVETKDEPKDQSKPNQVKKDTKGVRILPPPAKAGA